MHRDIVHIMVRHLATHYATSEDYKVDQPDNNATKGKKVVK